MKIIISLNLLIILGLNNDLIGQEYKFDKVVKNEFVTPYFPDQERTNLYNSNDFTYNMHIYMKNGSLKSWIMDYKRNQIHRFNVIEGDTLKWIYIRSENFEKKSNNNFYEFSEVFSKRGKKYIKLKIYNEKKRTIAKFKLHIKETDENYFPVYQLSGAMEPFHTWKVKSPLNFIVLNAKRNSAKYSLISIEDIEVTIRIPKN